MTLNLIWYSSARAQLRRVDREIALRILTALTRYAETGDAYERGWARGFPDGVRVRSRRIVGLRELLESQ